MPPKNVLTTVSQNTKTTLIDEFITIIILLLTVILPSAYQEGTPHKVPESEWNSCIFSRPTFNERKDLIKHCQMPNAMASTDTVIISSRNGKNFKGIGDDLAMIAHWKKNGPDVRSFEGKTVQLAIKAGNADIYSIAFLPCEPAPELPSYFGLTGKKMIKQ